MDITMKQLNNILLKGINKKVQYRRDGDREFVNDLLVGYEIGKDESTITIELQKDKVKTDNVELISYTQYEERIDIWIYGDKTNRFDIYIPSYELIGTI